MHSLISYAFRFISIPANVSATIWDIAQQAKMLNRNWFNNDSIFVLSGWGLAVAPCVLQNRCQLMRLTPVHSHIFEKLWKTIYIFSIFILYHTQYDFRTRSRALPGGGAQGRWLGGEAKFPENSMYEDLEFSYLFVVKSQKSHYSSNKHHPHLMVLAGMSIFFYFR